MKKFIRFFVLVFTAVLFSCLLNACASTDPSTLKTYNLGRDKVPSVTSVVGERTVTGVDTEDRNEFPSKQFAYQSNSVSDDLGQYIELLQEKGWTISGDDFNLEEPLGSVQFVKESVESGQILELFITYSENEYVIKVTKLEALITHSGSDSK